MSKRSLRTRSHLVIPDTQVKPGVPINHLGWISRYAAERRPDVIIHLGDHYDMPSMSSYDQGKKSFEGRRYVHDVAAGNLAWDVINEHIDEGIAKSRRSRRKVWSPERHYLLGNHEHRIMRAVDEDARLDGAIGFHDFVHPGWERHEFLEVVELDGVKYSHYFSNKQSGRPLSGASIDARIKTIGSSFTHGHQQMLLFGRRETYGRAHYGLVAGNCYLHDEDYRGIQANDEWRGVIVKNQIEDGTYDPMFVSLDYLCRKYEGMRLSDFLAPSNSKNWMVF